MDCLIISKGKHEGESLERLIVPMFYCEKIYTYIDKVESFYDTDVVNEFFVSNDADGLCKVMGKSNDKVGVFLTFKGFNNLFLIT